MKVKNLGSIVVFLCFLGAIWSNEPVKMILSGLFIHFVFKYSFPSEKVIGKVVFEKVVPVDMTMLIRRK